MLVKRSSNNRILKNNSGICVNNEVSVLQIVNANAFGFQFMSSGPVTISWGDGTQNVYSSAQTTYVKPYKTYSSIGTWNISISNPQNITALYFQNGNTWYGELIATNSNWFSQFYNLQCIYLINSSFIGDISNTLEKLYNLIKLRTIHFISS